MEIILCTKEAADDYLMHWRTKGSKNGVRRWQYENGSLTPEGYKHYAEMYGWGNKLKKAERLQNRADKAADKAEKASRKADDDYVKSYKAERKNERWSTERRQEKADRAKEIADESKAKSELLSVKARQAQKKASDYADKLQRKEDKLSKFMNEDGSLNDEALRKYTYTTGVPGERKMSLVGRMIFGREYSNKFNKENSNKMSKEDTKTWEDDERKKFDEENKQEDLMNRSDKLIDKLGQDGEMTEKERKKFGDDLLSYLDDAAKAIRNLPKNADINAAKSYGSFDSLREWLCYEVDEKSGSINSDYYYRGTNAEKAYTKAEQTWAQRSERQSQIEKDIGYNRNIQNSKKYQAEAQRLKRALENDSVWKNLDKQWDKDWDEVLGGVLKDIGFSDTPQNRRILYAYGWYD